MSDNTWAAKVLEGVPRFQTMSGNMLPEADALAAIARMAEGDGLVASIAAITCPEAEVMSDGARLTALIHYADKAAARIAALTAQVAEKEEQLVSVLQREAATQQRHDAKMEAAEAERDALRDRVEKDAKAHEKEIAVWAENYAALERKVARLEGALVDHNDLLRSALSIAKREGVDGEVASTNWDAYYNRVAVVLKRYHQTANEARAALTDGGKDE